MYLVFIKFEYKTAHNIINIISNSIYYTQISIANYTYYHKTLSRDAL